MDNLIREYLSYNPETGDLTWIKSPSVKNLRGKKAGHLNKRGYVRLILKGKGYFCHRVAWFLHYDKWPEYEIDHINGNKSDNSIKNLRDVPSHINQANKPCHRNGVLWGTSFHPKTKTYLARFTFNKKTYSLKYHKTMKEAHEVSMKKLKEILYGS